MNPNACRVCLTIDVQQLCSLFLSDDGESYADLVTFSCGVDVKYIEITSEKMFYQQIFLF